MGFFDFFKKQNTGNIKNVHLQAVNNSSYTKDIHQIVNESDIAIDEMQKADEIYLQDGNLENRIAVYEKYLLEKPLWNSFNFNLSLAEMYFKSGQNNKAWAYLNRMTMWYMDPNVPGGNMSKIMREQFKILKSEKKYKDAFVHLTESYVVNAYDIDGMYFNKAKYIKEIKTTAKAIGILEEGLNLFADEIEEGMKSKIITPDNVRNYCISYFKKNKII